MDIINCTPAQWYEHEIEFLKKLEDRDIYNQIPLLNISDLHNLKDLSLVRFQGMIQDMHGPELYLEKFEVINEQTKQVTTKIGKYVDIASCGPNEVINEDGSSGVRSDRQTYVAISIPAVNSWVYEIQEDKYKVSVPVASSSTTQKRPVEDMEVEHSEPTDANKKQCRENGKPKAANLVSREHLLNFPIPDSRSKVCHVKIYQDAESLLKLKLNSVCEFVGFLSVDPALACNIEDSMNDVEFQVHNPPPSVIPRLHCVSFDHIWTNNPLTTETATSQERMQFLRKELLILLTQLMCGDELAAEYLIYNLISEVYSRKDFLALGKFSLNISNVPKLESLDYVQELYKFIEFLTTKSHYLAMSLENMNELTFIPKKDYTSNRLTSGMLQVSDNTHLVLDETKLSAGKLNAAGVNAVKAISNVIKNQKMTYDFTYYQTEYDCDIPFLIMSEGKSLLPSDVHVVLQPDEMHINTFPEILQAARHFLKPDLLNDIRVYLTSVASVDYNIVDGVQEWVQNEFVEMRQRRKVTGDDLHNLLVLARLVCISQGKASLDEECWKRACSLEANRKDRIKK